LGEEAEPEREEGRRRRSLPERGRGKKGEGAHGPTAEALEPAGQVACDFTFSITHCFFSYIYFLF
jgi:hypothetical protein